MSTHPRRHPMRKRQQLSTQHPSLFKHILRPLASKGKASPSHLGTPALHLEHNNIRGEQDTAAPAAREADVKLQNPATSQPLNININPLSSDHGFTPSPLLPPHPMASSLKQQQYAAVAPSKNIYFNRVPLASDDDGFPEFAPGTLLSGVVTHETDGLSTPYGNLQLQETIQNPQGQDYWVPALNALADAVWTAIAQPTIGVYQDQSSQYTNSQHPPISTQPLPAVQPAHPATLPPIQPSYHALLQQNSQPMSCVNCPSIWRSHFESITFSSLENKGISDVQRSYRDLQQHIHVAHLWHYGAACACALCENLFCYHLGKMMHLEVATGDFADVKINLGNSFMTLREHIQEAHGGC